LWPDYTFSFDARTRSQCRNGRTPLDRLTLPVAPLYNADMEKERNTVTLVHRGRRFEVPDGSTLRDSIRRIGLSPEAVLAAREGELITDDRILKAGEEIHLVAVISGG
jgi:sulfur carrier protein ThiS